MNVINRLRFSLALLSTLLTCDAVNITSCTKPDAVDVHLLFDIRAWFDLAEIKDGNFVWGDPNVWPYYSAKFWLTNVTYLQIASDKANVAVMSHSGSELQTGKWAKSMQELEQQFIERFSGVKRPVGVDYNVILDIYAAKIVDFHRPGTPIALFIFVHDNVFGGDKGDSEAVKKIQDFVKNKTLGMTVTVVTYADHRKNSYAMNLKTPNENFFSVVYVNEIETFDHYVQQCAELNCDIDAYNVQRTTFNDSCRHSYHPTAENCVVKYTMDPLRTHPDCPNNVYKMCKDPKECSHTCVKKMAWTQWNCVATCGYGTAVRQRKEVDWAVTKYCWSLETRECTSAMIKQTCPGDTTTTPTATPPGTLGPYNVNGDDTGSEMILTILISSLGVLILVVLLTGIVVMGVRCKKEVQEERRHRRYVESSRTTGSNAYSQSTATTAGTTAAGTTTTGSPTTSGYSVQASETTKSKPKHGRERSGGRNRRR